MGTRIRLLAAAVVCALSAGPALAKLFVLTGTLPTLRETPMISSSGVVVGGSGGPMVQGPVLWCPRDRRPDRVFVQALAAAAPAPAPAPAAPAAPAPGPVPAYGVRLDDGRPTPAPAFRAPPVPRKRAWEGPAPRAEELDDFDAQVFAEP